MKVHAFSGSGSHYGFTEDSAGSNLPAEYSPWSYQKEIELEPNTHRIGMDVDKAVKEIATKGWYVTKAEIKFDEISGK